jgi:hypothetical protein
MAGPPRFGPPAVRASVTMENWSKEQSHVATETLVTSCGHRQVLLGGADGGHRTQRQTVLAAGHLRSSSTSRNVVAAKLLDPPDGPKVLRKASAATGEPTTKATELLSCWDEHHRAALGAPAERGLQGSGLDV